MTKRLAFLGPAGTNTEQIAIVHDPDATLLPFPSVPAVAAAVDSGMADEGVVAIENSLEGSVTSNLDLLIHESNLFIRHELVLPIQHLLLSKPETKSEEVRVVYSHPQALGQCRSYLAKCFPDAQLAASLSTSAAVEEMQSSDVPAAAIANQRSAELYGAHILARHVQDDPNNETRFVVLAREDHPPTGKDKTSICFNFEHDAAGILYSVMGAFAKRGINLTKIESRPTRESLGRYIFLVDLEGHREDPVLKEALDEVKAQVSLFKVFGSYPMHVSSAVSKS
jgi:prephenate dehydratase